MTNLKKKTLDGLAWTFAQQFGVQAVNFIVSVILARVLLPAEFGLIGMIAIFIAIGKSLIDGGMTSSLLRTKDPDQLDYSSVFYTNLAISVVTYAVVFFMAPYIAAFYSQPTLTDLVRVYCLTFIIAAFSTVQATKLNKEMKFKTQMIINIPSQIVGSILGIAMAYNGYGVWSLVYMSLCQVFISTIQLWLYSGWMPSRVLDYGRLKTHFNFGYKLTLSSLMNATVKNLYNIIIGRFFSAAQLGFFIRGKSMQELPVTNLGNALNKVTYPMFASIGDQDQKLRSIYERMMQVVFFIITPIMLLSIVIAEPLFRWLFTEKWLPSVPYFKIFCIAGIFMTLNSYNLNILLVKGQSSRHLRLETVKSVLTLLSLLLAIPYGIYGILWGIVAIAIITFAINSYFCGQVLEMRFTTLIKALFPILFVAILCGVIAFYIDRLFFSSYIDLLRITLVSFVFGICYLAISALVKIAALQYLKSLIKKKAL